MGLTRRRFLSSATALLPLAAEALGPARAALADDAFKDGFRVLTAAKASFGLVPGKPKTVLAAFAGEFPGPLLRYKLGEEIKIRLVNGLDGPASFSCQGVRLPNAMDGTPPLTQSPVPPGQSFDYRFTPLDAGFYWYRSHVLGTKEADPGLFGPLIIEEADPPQVDRDLAVILADWHLTGAAQLAAGAQVKPTDVFLVTVNAAAAPATFEAAPGARWRLRLLSLIGSELPFLTFTGMKPLVVAIDGQPCEPFEPLRETLPVGPGATFDLICDLPEQSGSEARLSWRTGAASDRPLVIVNMRGAPLPKRPPPAPLPANPKLPSRIGLEQAKRAELIFETDGKADGPVGNGALPGDRHGRLTLNGKTAETFAPEPLFAVKRGTPVSLGFINKTPMLVQIYVHGQAMRLLHDLDDGWEPYWRSRVVIPEGRAKHVAFVADNHGKWAIECRTLELFPTRLVTWFQVT